MYQNRIQAFGIPGVNVQYISLSVSSLADQPQMNALPMQVQVTDIYEAARKRAIEEHELDKLFNPEFYDYQI
jgi:hypothetical protein